MNGLQLCYVGQSIYLGNFDACNLWRDRPKRTIHIYHDEQPGHCSFHGGLKLEYREHDIPDKSMLDHIWTYAQGSDELFVHCAAGIGRSPAVALLCLMARGVEWQNGLSKISYSTWTDYRHPIIPNWDRKVVEQIVNYGRDRCFTHLS